MEIHAFEVIGYLGTFVAFFAYLPAIFHLLKEHCSAAISTDIYFFLFTSSALLLIYAFSINSLVFVICEIMNMIVISLVILFARVFKDKVCDWHQKSVL